MRKFVVVFLSLISLIFLSNCHSEEKEKMVGIWKLEMMDINGTAIRGNSLGNWLWEFNEKGGYLFNVAGAVEKGTYKLDDHQLKLKSVTSNERPEQIYSIEKLDSSALHLASNTAKNKTMLFFIKIESEAVGEKD